MLWGHLEAKTQCPVGQLGLKKADRVFLATETEGWGLHEALTWAGKLPGSEDIKGNLLGFVVFVLWQQKLKLKPTEWRSLHLGPK